MILSIWSWSLLQFTLVLTATKERRDRSGVLNRKTTQQVITPPKQEGCCTPDVYGIIISIMLQDCPFLVLRMLLIFKYGVLSYTNMFFTCKNSFWYCDEEIKNSFRSSTTSVIHFVLQKPGKVLELPREVFGRFTFLHVQEVFTRKNQEQTRSVFTHSPQL